jgi:hypothetical protein
MAHHPFSLTSALCSLIHPYSIAWKHPIRGISHGRWLVPCNQFVNTCLFQQFNSSPIPSFSSGSSKTLSQNHQNPPQCMQAQKRIQLLNSPTQGSSGSHPCPRTLASVTDCCRQAFRHWKVIGSISSIGKGRNTDATLFQSNLAGRRALVLNGGGPCLSGHSGRGRVVQVCWGGGL